MRSDLRPRDADEVSALLSAVVDGDPEVAPEVRLQLEQDLRFQAELVQYRKLRRALHGLRDDIRDPGEELAVEVLAALDEQLERGSLLASIGGRRAAYLGGLAAATAAGVGTALVLVRRRAA